MNGSFEHPEFRAINDALLQAAGSGWWDASFTPDLLTIGAKAVARERAEAFVDDLLARGVQLERICSLRAPGECAASRIRRAADGRVFYAGVMQEPAVYALWVAYHVSWLDQETARSAICVCHDALMSNPSATLEALRGLLYETPQSGDIQAASGFVDPALRRSAGAAGAGSWPDVSKALFQTFPPRLRPSLRWTRSATAKRQGGATGAPGACASFAPARLPDHRDARHAMEPGFGQSNARRARRTRRGPRRVQESRNEPPVSADDRDLFPAVGGALGRGAIRRDRR